MEGSLKATLKDRWKQHYQERSFFISYQRADHVCVAYTLYFFLGGYYYTMFRLIPAAYSVSQEGGTVLFARAFATLVLVELLCNWFQCVRKYLNAVHVAVPRSKEQTPMEVGPTLVDGAVTSPPATTDRPVGWRHCPICQLSAPPRSHHCRVCRACMLKHDHHCFLTGGCIGYYTQRNFFNLSVWSLVAGTLLVYLVFRAAADLPLPSVDAGLSYVIVFTPIYWLAGSVTLSEMLAVVHIYFLLANIAMSAFYVLVEAILISRNQTLWELGKGISKYDAGFWENVRSALGSYWLLGFILPWWTALPGDGCNFPNGKQLKCS